MWQGNLGPGSCRDPHVAVSLLRKRFLTATQSIMLAACKTGNLPEVQRLLALNTHPTQNALWQAVTCNHVDVVRELLQWRSPRGKWLDARAPVRGYVGRLLLSHHEGGAVAARCLGAVAAAAPRVAW